MAEFLLLIYIAYLVGMGQAWYRLLVRSSGRNWTELAWGFGLGTILWGYAQFLLNVFNLPVHGAWIYFWQTALVAVPIIFRHSSVSCLLTSYRRKPVPSSLLDWAPTSVGVTAKDDARFRRGDGIKWLKILSSVIITIAFVTAALQALAFPLHMWDSIVLYGFKAKILFLEQTFKTDAFMDPTVLHHNADYPLLLPYLEAGFYRWLGHPDDRVIRLLFLAFWASWLSLVYEALAARIRRDYALMLVGFMATLPLFSNMYMGQAVSGFADIPFAFYWTGFILCGLTRSREGSPARWGLLPLLAVGCTFIKGEGWPAVLIGAGFLALSGPSKHRRSWIGLVLSAAVLLAPWLWARRELPHNAPHYFRLLALPSGEILYRVRLVAGAWLREVSAVRSWGLFWLMALLGVFWPRSRLVFPKESKLILAAVLAQFCVYAYVYLTYRDSLELLLPITLLRLTVHSTGLVIMALGWRLED